MNENQPEKYYEQCQRIAEHLRFVAHKVQESGLHAEWSQYTDIMHYEDRAQEDITEARKRLEYVNKLMAEDQLQVPKNQ